MKLLTEKGISSAKCPMCGNDNFSLVDSLSVHTLYKMLSNISRSCGILCIVLYCYNCGFMSEYSIYALGLFNEAEING